MFKVEMIIQVREKSLELVYRKLFVSLKKLLRNKILAE